ncbi:MAG: hypothetical protein Q9P01_10925 [Anaerolineae bacterium]|nr:hypothetical protein [Anaerolineae bacterium]
MKSRLILPRIVLSLLFITIILLPHNHILADDKLICSQSTEAYTSQVKPEDGIRFAVIGDYGTLSYIFSGCR